MGMAGKLPSSLKALDAGISPDELLVDVAQAGGLHGRGDGLLRAADGSLQQLEIKVCMSALFVFCQWFWLLSILNADKRVQGAVQVLAARRTGWGRSFSKTST